MWNKQNAQAVEQSNINWRRKSNTIDSAAQNAANMMNAQQSFAMDSAEQNFLWQQARDKATYLRQAYENEEQRKTTLYATALASEGGFEGTGPGPESLVDLVSQIFNGPLGEEEEDTGDVS
jgi:murein L,D-transpeptidase YcbB/YkuD